MTVRPARAAGLILLRRTALDSSDGFEVLLGRRHPRSRFMPNVYVFPGGRLDTADNQPSGFAETLPAPPKQVPLTSADLYACARAAMRETYEETGLLLGMPGVPKPVAGQQTRTIWSAFAGAGLAPAFSAMRLVARAVTPATSPIRFDTYFFIADGVAACGNLAGDGELEDIGWVPANEAPTLPMAEVTRLVLGAALARFGQAAGRGDLPTFSV